MATETLSPGLGNFNPHNYADLPLYNIQAVAATTGVPAITLRSWERRYGIPEPKRDAKGYRLYSERDIAVARWLKDRVQQGVGISRAVNMLQVLQSGDVVSERPTTFDFQSLRGRLVEAIRNLDEVAVNRVIGEALVVAPVEEVALDLLQPALYAVGSLWAEGVLSVTSEHMGTNLVRAHIAQLIRISPPPYRKPKIVVGTAPGEQHDMGALIVTLFLRRRGFDVIYVGASVEPDSFITDVRRIGAAAVLMSASSPETAANLRQLYRGMEGLDTTLAYGGRVFNDHPAISESIPGTYLGCDAGEGTRRLEEALSFKLSG